MSKKTVILVVEDEKKQAELIANYVEAIGNYRAVIANNGVEAFQLLKKHRRFLGFAENEIKCILLDIRMPDMDGLTFLKQLRQDEKINAYHRYIPVIILSAYNSQEYTTKAIHPDYGMVAGYLVKPIDKLQLQNLLNQILCLKISSHLIDKTHTQFKRNSRQKFRSYFDR